MSCNQERAEELQSCSHIGHPSRSLHIDRASRPHIGRPTFFGHAFFDALPASLWGFGLRGDGKSFFSD